MRLFARLDLKRIFSAIFTPALWGKPYVYVALGDSTVEGIGASHQYFSYPSVIMRLIKRTKKHAQLYNLGKSGAIIDDVIRYQLEKAIALKPNLITISVGANDIIRHTPKKKFESDLAYLLTTLAKQTQAVIVINNIPDFSLARAVPWFLRLYAKYIIRRFNSSFESSIERGERLLLFDIHRHIQHHKHHLEELTADDGFHPSDRGYELWGRTMFDHCKNMIAPVSVT